MNKGETLEQIESGLKITEKVGIPYGMYLVANFPGEEDEDVEMTINLINRWNPNWIGCYNFTPYPNTPAWNNLITEEQRKEYSKDSYSKMYHASKEEHNDKIKYIYSKII
jgi:radical SAM superfamily enzyme YgiQ (UPF0313 family)